MPRSKSHGLYIQAASKVAERVPGLRALPVMRLIMAGEVLVLGKHHLDQLRPDERAALVRLLARAKGRPRNLSPAEQQQLAVIVEKLEPRLFLAEATDRISPVAVPDKVRTRLIEGKPRT